MRTASVFLMFKTTLVLYCCFVIVSVSGWELQSSMEKQLDGNIQVRFGRFLVWTTTTTSTSFTLIFTQLLTTYRSCYQLLAAQLATLPCTATATGTPFTTAAGLIGFNGNLTALAVQQALLTGRKRREAKKEAPILKIGDQPMLSYQGYIDATKVSDASEVIETEKAIEDVRKMNSRHPRLLTVLETSVLSTSTTVTLTTTALEVRRLQFSSDNANACWPISDLLATIPICV